MLQTGQDQAAKLDSAGVEALDKVDPDIELLGPQVVFDEPVGDGEFGHQGEYAGAEFDPQVAPALAGLDETVVLGVSGSGGFGPRRVLDVLPLGVEDAKQGLFGGGVDALAGWVGGKAQSLLGKLVAVVQIGTPLAVAEVVEGLVHVELVDDVPGEVEGFDFGLEVLQVWLKAHDVLLEIPCGMGERLGVDERAKGAVGAPVAVDVLPLLYDGGVADGHGGLE